MKLGLAVLLLLTGGLQARDGAALSHELSLKVSATAQGPNVLLGDLVVEKLPPALAGMSVKVSGRPGGSVEVDSALVALKLKRDADGPWHLNGPKSVHVDVPAQKVPGSVLRDFATDFLKQQLSGTAGVEIQPQGGVQDLVLYGAPLKMTVRPAEGATLRGNLVLRVDVAQEIFGGEQRVAATVPVSFLVKRRESRLVTKGPIRRGDVLGPDNLEQREQDATFDHEGVADLAAVQGKVARVFIPAGKPLTAAMVEQPLAVHRGDMVRLLVRSGAVVVEASAKAMRDARIGESIPLQVDGSDRQVQARCVDAGVMVREAP